jgi:hypothetical protein
MDALFSLCCTTGFTLLLPDYFPFGYVIQLGLKGPLLTMDSCNLQDTQRYKLSDAIYFYYLNQSSCIEVEGTNDAEEYLATSSPMDIIGINRSVLYYTETIEDTNFSNNDITFLIYFIGSYIQDWKYKFLNKS